MLPVTIQEVVAYVTCERKRDEGLRKLTLCILTHFYTMRKWVKTTTARKPQPMKIPEYYATTHKAACMICLHRNSIVKQVNRDRKEFSWLIGKTHMANHFRNIIYLFSLYSVVFCCRFYGNEWRLQI